MRHKKLVYCKQCVFIDFSHTFFISHVQLACQSRVSKFRIVITIVQLCSSTAYRKYLDHAARYKEPSVLHRNESFVEKLCHSDGYDCISLLVFIPISSAVSPIYFLNDVPVVTVVPEKTIPLQVHFRCLK